MYTQKQQYMDIMMFAAKSCPCFDAYDGNIQNIK